MKLLTLHCPRCAQPLHPDLDDAVAMSCPHCWTAVSLDTERGLTAANVHYGVPTSENVTDWLPFWIFRAQVQIQARETQGGNRSAQEAARHFWSVMRTLYAPAWDLPVPQARTLGASLLAEQCTYREADAPPGVGFVTAVIQPADALKLLEFVILTIEAQRQDWLKRLEFHIDAGPPQLWVLPAQASSAYNWYLLAETV